MSNTTILKLSKSIMIVMIIMSSTSCSFIRDNAVNLAYDLEAAAKTLKSQKIGSEFVINYKPLDTEAPFTILIFSASAKLFKLVSNDRIVLLISLCNLCDCSSKLEKFNS